MMTKLTLSVLAVAGALAFSGAAWAQCPGHENQTVQSDTPQTVVDGSTTLPTPTPAPETKTGG
jgi:hypothetical protein